MDNYVVLSIETHLFFARIMKEHALFLEAGFPCKEEKWIQKADWFREQFEDLLWQVVRMSDGMASADFLESGEMVTEFTLPAERQTQCLTGISIDSALTEAERKLSSGNPERVNRGKVQAINRINERAVCLLNGLIDFKEHILQEVKQGELFTANYPLLIQHIQREAKLYRAMLQELMQNWQISRQNLWETEEFWDRIMMEHALFIRGLLDPTEVKLICTADEFAETFRQLLEAAKEQNCRVTESQSQQGFEETLKETQRLRDFKTAGTEGILSCNIASIILPLLADHVLREANHYIRILEAGYVR